MPVWQCVGMSGRPPPCVLLSGGVDSALVGQFLLDTGPPPTAIFIDYGQPAAQAEAQASHAVARHLGLSLQQLTVRGLSVANQGEIAGRNDLLIAVALAAAPGRDVAIGVHAGTGYLDCSSDHNAAWQTLLDVQHEGKVRLLAPLINLTKGEVLRLVSNGGLPLAMTHSCETSNLACGTCDSCLDRADFDALP